MHSYVKSTGASSKPFPPNCFAEPLIFLLQSFEDEADTATAVISINFSFENMPETKINYVYGAYLDEEDDWVLTFAELLDE